MHRMQFWAGDWIAIVVRILYGLVDFSAADKLQKETVARVWISWEYQTTELLYMLRTDLPGITQSLEWGCRENAAALGCLSVCGQNTVTRWGGIANVVRNRWLSWGWVAFLLRPECSFEVVIGWWMWGEYCSSVGLSCLSRCGLNAVLRWLLECVRIP